MQNFCNSVLTAHNVGFAMALPPTSFFCSVTPSPVTTGTNGTEEHHVIQERNYIFTPAKVLTRSFEDGLNWAGRRGRGVIIF